MALDDEEEGLTSSPPDRGRPKEVDLFTSVRCLGYLSSLNLLVAVCVGMYVRWDVTDEPMILVIFILGLFVLAIACILHYYFAMEKASLSLFHLWFGFLLGLLCFLNSPALDADIKEMVANYLLLASVVMKAVWAATERVCRSLRHKPALLTSDELLELLGFAIASTAMVFHKSVAIVGLAVALGGLIVDLRMKSLLALPNLACFTLVTALVFFKALGIAANPFALGCYLGRLLCEPLLDVYFSGLGPTERWLPVLSMGKVWRRLSLLPLSLAELAFFILAAFKVKRKSNCPLLCISVFCRQYFDKDVFFNPFNSILKTLAIKFLLFCQYSFYWFHNITKYKKKRKTSSLLKLTCPPFFPQKNNFLGWGSSQ